MFALHPKKKKEEEEEEEEKRDRIAERVGACWLVGFLTAGSEWLPEQSAKRRRGSGWRTAKARHSSPPALLARRLAFVVVLG